MRACWIALGATLSSTALPAQEAGDRVDADILVIARKLRTVRIDYQTVGSHLKRCDIMLSSGDARIDRILCAMLKACVKEGNDGIRSARRCLSAKIDEVEAYRPSLAQADTHAPAAPPPVVQTVPAPPAPPAEQAVELTVTAPRLPAAGRWRFRALQAFVNISGSSGAPSSWEQCIAPDATENTLVQMIGGQARRGPGGACRMLKLSVADGKISARRRCINPTSRLTSRISGRYSADRIQFEMETEIMMLKRPEEGEESHRQTLASVAGSRIGECKR